MQYFIALEGKYVFVYIFWIFNKIYIFYQLWVLFCENVHVDLFKGLLSKTVAAVLSSVHQGAA